MSATDLVGLGARRTLGRGLLAVLAVLWVVVLLGRPELARYGVEPDPALARLDIRRVLWSTSLAFLLPALVLRAAGIRQRWRDETRLWVGARPLAHASAIARLAAGTWCAGAALLFATALLAELAAGGDGPALRLQERVEHPSLALLDDARLASPPLPPLAAESRLALRLTPVPGATAAASTVQLWLQEEDGRRVSATLESSATDGTRRRLFVREDARAPRLHLRREGDAPLFLAADSLEVLRAGARERDAAGLLFVAALLAWTVWCALACALGAWLRPALAGLACLALWCLPWAFSFAPGSVPGTALPGMLQALERGLVPPAPPLSDGLAAALAVLVGAVLVRRREA